MKSLTELLDDARQYADLTGDGALYLAPGVTTAEAHVAAWHAIAVQGGYATPSVEAWRLSGDKGVASREQAFAALNDPAALHVNEVNIELVRKAIGDADFMAGTTSAMVVPDNRQASSRYGSPATLAQPEAATNDRGEFTGTDGKLHHQVSVPQAPDFAIHEGDWLSCDGCNPPVVVEAEPHNLNQTSELYDLRGRYAELKAAKDKATEEFDAVKGKLQTALAEASGGALRAELRVPGFKPMTLIYTEPWRVDSKRLKAEQPAIYVQYAKQGSQWTLAESRAKS